MMQYRSLGKDEQEETYEAIAGLFREMYNFMGSRGMQLSLKENGETQWIKSASRAPGKVNHLIIAEDSQSREIAGFAHGNIRLAPEHLGGFKIGFISHLYVKKNFRRQGIASELADRLIQSLESTGAKQLELDVLVKNEEALNFWSQKGFIKELIRMSKKRSQ